MVNQAREKEGDMSHPLTQQACACSENIARCSNITRNTLPASTGGEPLKFYVAFPLSGRKPFKLYIHPKVCGKEEVERVHSAQSRSP